MANKRGYVDTADGQIHYRREDSGSSGLIVLFHMTASSSGSYEPLMKTLAGQYSTIAFDTPNYGQSYKTSKTPTMDYIAQVMLESLTNLGIESFHVLGHHTGASIAVAVARAAQHRVQTATLSGLVYLPPHDNAALGRALIMDNPISPYGTQIMWAWTRIMKMDSLPVPASIMNREMIDTLTAGEAWHWAYKAVFSYDCRLNVHLLRCPIFLVAGERDLALPYHQLAAAALPEARVLTAKGHGVYYLETGAADFAPDLIEFIEHSRHMRSQ